MLEAFAAYIADDTLNPIAAPIIPPAIAPFQASDFQLQKYTIIFKPQNIFEKKICTCFTFDLLAGDAINPEECTKIIDKNAPLHIFP